MNKVISFGDVIEVIGSDEALGTICTQISEGATREIASLPPDQQIEVVNLASPH